MLCRILLERSAKIEACIIYKKSVDTEEKVFLHGHSMHPNVKAPVICILQLLSLFWFG